MRTVTAVLLLAGIAVAQPPAAPPTSDPMARPGPTKDGFLLPNGWHLTPAGRHVEITDLPLNIHPLKDGRHALVATNGYNRHEVSLIDLKDAKVVAKEWEPQSWFGFAVNKAEDKLWWSGGGGGQLH